MLTLNAQGEYVRQDSQSRTDSAAPTETQTPASTEPGPSAADWTPPSPEQAEALRALAMAERIASRNAPEDDGAPDDGSAASDAEREANERLEALQAVAFVAPDEGAPATILPIARTPAAPTGIFAFAPEATDESGMEAVVNAAATVAPVSVSPVVAESGIVELRLSQPQEVPAAETEDALSDETVDPYHWWPDGARLYQPIIEAAIAANDGPDAAMLIALIEAESAYEPLAVSQKGALGLMQLMPATAERYGVTNPFSPSENIQAGTSELSSLLHDYTNPALALAAYNAGRGAVDKYDGIPPFEETRDYVLKVLERTYELRATAANPAPQNLTDEAIAEDAVSAEDVVLARRLKPMTIFVSGPDDTGG